MDRSIVMFCLLFSVSCRKEGGSLDTTGDPQALTVNEAVTSGSEQTNEFGDRADWFEIHNAGPVFRMAQGQWFVSDDENDPMKFELPEVTVPENGFLVVWCDDMDIAGEQVHTNFSLAAEGETLVLAHRTTAGVEIVDRVELGDAQGAQGTGQGRYPDGSAGWHPLAWPTPGGPNEPLDTGR